MCYNYGGDFMEYINVIKYAILFFPILCLILSLPFLFHHYRKYGSITFSRFLLVFSFFFYLLCAYFLVILPLPSKAEVMNYNGIYYNLKPFFVVPEIFMSGEFNLIKPETYMFLYNQRFLEPLFNILMTIPFGIYLRYYFKCGFFKTLFLSFLLSLFFELTQLSGLYFYYPRPYRLCDVNDLINNTTGGLIGFVIAPLFSLILPSRESIDDKSYEKGRVVSVLRESVALIIDYFFIVVLYLGIGFLFHGWFNIYFYLFLVFFMFCLIPLFSSGYTFGKWLLGFRNVGIDIDGSISFFKYFIKFLVLHLFVINGWIVYMFLCNIFRIDYVFGFIVFLTVLFIFILYCFFCLILNRNIFINRMLGISNDSVISVWDDDDEI